MIKLVVISFLSLFILVACEGGLAGILGLTAPDVVIPEFTLDVAVDNTNIRLSADGGSFDRLDMSYCGSGAIDEGSEGSECRLLASVLDDTGTFLFTQSNVLDYESGDNALQSKAVGGAESGGGSTGSLAGSTTYNFQLDATAMNSNTGVGDAESIKMSATTYDTDNNLTANVPYAEVSHSLSSFDTSFDLMGAIRDVQRSQHTNDSTYTHTFENFPLENRSGSWPTNFQRCRAFSNTENTYDQLDRQSNWTCSTGRSSNFCEGKSNPFTSWTCTRSANVQVSIPGRWMWIYESALADTALSNHSEVACSYSRPENYIAGLEPFLTNSARNAGLLGTNDRQFYGHNVSDVDTTISFIDEEDAKPDTEPTLNENIASTLTDSGERVFAFDSKYTDAPGVGQVSFTPSVGLFGISRTPVVISCTAAKDNRVREASVNIYPPSIYTPRPITSDKAVRTLTYRVPLSVAFTKPSSATYGVLPTSHSGFPARVSESDTNYISYNFYTNIADATFSGRRSALNLPSSLLASPLPVVSQHGEELRYRFDVVGQYKVE